ncbi:hypothetical protein KR009_007598, partial [Drosophila setifemur]
EYANDEDAIFVSAQEYGEKKSQIDQLVQQMLAMEQVRRQLEADGSDNEELADLKQRLEKLNVRLEVLGEFLDTLRVKEDQPVGRIKEDSMPDIETPRWPNLYAGLSRQRDKTKHTLAEFFQHKSNVINSLKMLYEPNEPSPSVEDVAEQPALLTVRLLKHQQSGLRWMQFRERQKISGGILADDMGLGKTLSMIALLVASLEAKQKKRAAKRRALEDKWTKELQRLKVKKTRKFSLFDDEEESPEREEKYEPPKKRACSPPEEEFSDSEEEDQMASFRYPKAGTLVVCPMSVMCQWAEEVATKVAPNAIKVLTFHGNNRNDIGIEAFRSYDMVITSYNLLVREHKRFANRSLLFAVHWNRVILDEAHIIRNVKTIGCISVCQLRANYHWALTGTPVQNRAVDVFALLRFLGVPNFLDLQMWRKYLNNGMKAHRRLGAIIKPLLLRRTKQQLQANGVMPALPPIKYQMISVQLSEAEMAVYEILSAISQRIFAQFLSQRDNDNSDLNYYSVEHTPQFIGNNLDEKNMEIYHRFLKFLGYDPSETVQGIVLLVLLLRLRQFCCHPGLMVKMLCGSMTSEEVDCLRSDARDVEGQLKMDVLTELDKLHPPRGDNESFEEECSTIKLEVKEEPIKEEKLWDHEEVNSHGRSSANPLEPASALKLLNPENPIFKFAQPSAKLKLIIAKLEELLTNTNDKIIVVSQWISYLGVIRQRLHDLSWETLDFTGQLNAEERQLVLREFNVVNNEKRVLLLSLTAGGVGLNLNVANHMLLVDLHWNPQMERQAQDRIYRYGQTKPTFIYRFMCLDTVEQRIKALQEYKLEIAKVVIPDEEGVLAPRGGGGINLVELKKLFSM